ncbi:MAG: gluconolaconase [Actinomycetota bacterium]|nr:gluconolaconase [Actinomycetota bacterium]
MSEPTNRWTTYTSEPIDVASGWSLETVVEPARLGGANGIVWSPDGRLMVTQVFGSQVTAIDVDSGEHQPFAALGGGICAPDDGAFGIDGTFFATEPMNATVSARTPDGTYRVLHDDLPGANGMTVSHDGRRLFVDEFRPGGRLLELDPSGERPPVVLADDLAMPNAFAMGPDGALWFPQVLAGEIWRFDLETRKLDRRFTDLATPTAVKFDAQGRLLTSEGGSGRLVRIDLLTGARETLAQVAVGIDNFAIGADGRLFVSHFTDGRVAEVSGGVERVLSPSGLIGPFGLDRMIDGSLLTADALAVNRTGPEPGSDPQVILSLLAQLPGMAIDVAHHGADPLVLLARGQVLRRRDDGRLDPIAGRLQDAMSMTSARGGGAFVVERGTGRVLQLDGEGGMEVEVAGLDRPRAVAESADGTLWITRTGGVTAVLNGEVQANVDGFDDPHGIAVLDNEIVVAEPAHRRVVAVSTVDGSRRDLATGLPFGSAVHGARAPHSFSPVLADGSSVLVGCDGDGSVRRLRTSAG